MLIDKLVHFIMESSQRRLIVLSTFFVLAGSIPLVYAGAWFASVRYSLFLFELSIVLPLILTPVTILIIFRLTVKMKHFKEHLDKEIELNKSKDIILFEQARFVLMGEMMANISHQWKQPLNTINLALFNMKMSTIGLEKEDRNFEIIEENVNYMAATINDFMSFFDKRSNTEMKSIDELVHEIESVIGGSVRSKGIVLEMVVDENFSKIKVASSISQVILNLINNAKDALQESQTKLIRVLFLSNEYGLEIECCDEGHGIALELQEKIFDPYFTTKEKTQGTGIGLYMSKEIVDKVFQGKINICSRNCSRSTKYPMEHENKTCFFVALPYSDTCIKIGGGE